MGLTSIDAVAERLLEENVINSDGIDALIPGFHGIGPFVGKRASEFDRDEQVVLSYFFTNIDSNVYCAKDTMPQELWALIMGQFARAELSAKERLLKVFYDMEEKTGEGVKELAEKIRKGTDIRENLAFVLQKAGDFIIEYGVDYGHASLRDSENIRLIVEGLTQRATKEFEKAREGAYQEKSTRALRFGPETLAIPPEILGTEYETRWRALHERTLQAYLQTESFMRDDIEYRYNHLRDEASMDIRSATGNPDA
ncbi:MAG: hypothetical protein ABIA93_03640, partial [Candidatus Woesearchaeota archaeon]